MPSEPGGGAVSYDLLHVPYDLLPAPQEFENVCGGATAHDLLLVSYNLTPAPQDFEGVAHDKKTAEHEAALAALSSLAGGAVHAEQLEPEDWRTSGGDMLQRPPDDVLQRLEGIIGYSFKDRNKLRRSLWCALLQLSLGVKPPQSISRPWGSDGAQGFAPRHQTLELIVQGSPTRNCGSGCNA